MSYVVARERAVVLAAAALLLVGCSSDEPASRATAPDAPASSSATSSVPPATQTRVRSVLEGTWQTRPVSVRETVGTLRRHGLGEWVDDYRRNAPFSGDTVLTLAIEGGAWNLYGESAGKTPEPIDYDAEYDIDGDSVVFHHLEGSNAYRWEVDQDVLRLHFEHSTLPGYRGVPDEVFQRALYMTAEFVRQD